MRLYQKALIILSVAALLVYYVPFYSLIHSTFINWDGFGYYQYLPSAIIYHDFNCFRWIGNALAPYPTVETTNWLQFQHTSSYVSKYSLGSALMQLPFFLVACLVAWFGGYRCDGFSAPFQFAIYISGIVYLFIGLFILYKFLKSYYLTGVAWLSVVILFLGTNLFCYGVVTNQMSHIYGFACVSMLLYYSLQFQKTFCIRDFFGVGISLAIAIICRPTLAVFVLLPISIIWQHNKREVVWPSMKETLVLFIICLLPFLLQIFYWYKTTGQVFFNGYAYNGETFDFFHAKIGKGLFSIEKGWLIHTPLVALIFLGFIPAIKRYRYLSLTFILILGIWVYVSFSWHSWNYDAGFGARVMVDCLPLLVLPLAAGLEWVLLVPFRKFFLLLILPIIYVNLLQTGLMSEGLYPSGNVKINQYWKSFSQLGDFYDYSHLMHSQHHLPKASILSSSLLAKDNFSANGHSSIGSNSNAYSQYYSLINCSLKSFLLTKNNFIRVSGHGFYQQKDVLHGNKNILIFSVRHLASDYIWQATPLYNFDSDTLPSKNRAAVQFALDFKLTDLISPSDTVQVYFWNDSPTPYFLKSWKVEKLELKH